MIWFGVRTRAIQLRSRLWPVTSAEELQAQVEEFKRPEVYLFITYFRIKPAFRFRVNGKPYMSNQVGVDRNDWVSTDKREMEALLSQILSSKAVFYNPSRPEEAVLLRGLSKRRNSHYLAVALAGAMLVASAAGLAVLS